MMSEEGGFIDVESDEVPELGGEATASSSGQNSNDADTLVSGRPIVSHHLYPLPIIAVYVKEAVNYV